MYDYSTTGCQEADSSLMPHYPPPLPCLPNFQRPWSCVTVIEIFPKVDFDDSLVANGSYTRPNSLPGVTEDPFECSSPYHHPKIPSSLNDSMLLKIWSKPTLVWLTNCARASPPPPTHTHLSSRIDCKGHHPAPFFWTSAPLPPPPPAPCPPMQYLLHGTKSCQTV